MYLEILNEIIFVLALFFILKSYQNSQIGCSLDEHNWMKGKAFTYYFVANGLLPGDIASENYETLAICVGDYDIGVSELKLNSDADLMTWLWYEGSVIDKLTGTPTPEIRRNSTIESTSGCIVLHNPTVISEGQAMVAHWLDIYGLAVSGGRSHIREDIITQPYTLRANQTYLLRFLQRDATAKNIEIILNIFKVTK